MMMLLKIHEGLSSRFLAFLFGTNESTVARTLNAFRDFIHRTDTWLIKTRNLSDHLNLRALLDEAAADTLKNPRYHELFSVLCEEGEQLGKELSHKLYIKLLNFSHLDLGFNSHKHSLFIKHRATEVFIFNQTQKKCIS